MSAETKIKLLMVDDHQIVIDGMKALLRKEKQFEFIAEANSGEEALELLKVHTPDILISDISMPGMNGNELIKIVKEHYPDIKILVVSMHDDPETISEVLMLEAEGYILKNTGRKEFTTALEKLADGATFYSEEVLLSLMKKQKKEIRKDIDIAQLSAREIEIICLIAQECSNEEIAEKLFISKRTVETHRKNINQKTNIRTAVGLIKFAIRNELITI
jgi:DNA-binding NarL/FixJ family response regulator